MVVRRWRTGKQDSQARIQIQSCEECSRNNTKSNEWSRQVGTTALWKGLAYEASINVFAVDSSDNTTAREFPRHGEGLRRGGARGGKEVLEEGNDKKEYYERRGRRRGDGSVLLVCAFGFGLGEPDR